MEDGWTLYQPETEYAKLMTASPRSRGCRSSQKAESQQAASEWRISYVNSNYDICPTYPRAVIVPATMGDEVLRCSAKFRLVFGAVQK